MNDFNTRDYPEFPLKDFETCERVFQQTLGSRVRYVPAMVSISEFAVLYELAAGWHSDVDGHIIEFGTFCGSTTIAFAKGVQERGGEFVYTTDSHSWHIESAFISLSVFDALNLRGVIKQFLFDDMEFIQKLWQFPARLIFHDSDHMYGHVKETIQRCYPRLKNGGWMVFHDYTPGPDAVAQAVDEFLDTMPPVRVYKTDKLLCIQKDEDEHHNNRT